jgi:ATP-dependent Clp protease ATP-binding subunit ClpA
LSEIVVGQEHAVREVATELGLIKAGMVDPGKPASVMMFIGQTGTGKTELAKALARLYSSSRRLKTFTLGNFSEPHSVSGIIGVPPGYVGHEQGGRLVNELNADPYGVFLLDEADKAHPDVMQPFLNLFDEGWISDQRGNKAYANRAIFILTTNVGQRQIAELCRSGKSIEEITSMMKDTLSRIRHTKSNRPVFSAEFLARIKRVIVFRSLDERAMTGIAHRLCADLEAEWRAKRQKDLVLPDPLVEAIAGKAFAQNERAQGREGGRLVRKLIADVVEAPIQAAISADPDGYRGCTQVVVDYAPTPQSVADGNALTPGTVRAKLVGADLRMDHATVT